MATAAYHTQPARPSPDAVLAYLAAGHTNAEAAEHFHIHERSVRRIKQRASERNNSPIGEFAQGRNSEPRIRNADHDRHPVALQHFDPAGSAPAAPAARVFPPTADDVAGDHTLWRCPATGELMPIVPGTRRHDWERERRETHARHVARVENGTRAGPITPAQPEGVLGGSAWEPPIVMSRSADALPASTEPDRTGQQPFSAAESERTGPDTRPDDALVSGHVRTAEHPRPVPLPPGPPEPEPEPNPGPDPDPLPRPPLVQPTGMIDAYLRSKAAEVRRDGLLVLGWRWIDEHDMIGPFPSRGLLAVVLLAGLAVLGVLG